MNSCVSCSVRYESGGLDFIKHQCAACAKNPKILIQFNSFGEPVRVSSVDHIKSRIATLKAELPKLKRREDFTWCVTEEDFALRTREVKGIINRLERVLKARTE